MIDERGLMLTQKGKREENHKMEINGMCWNCGKREATKIVYGYPICDGCAEEGIDPEEMELVVIESIDEGHLTPLDTINRKETKR